MSGATVAEPGGRDGVRLAFDATDRRLAAAAWSRLAEPGDEAAGVLLAHLGPVAALDWAVAGGAAVPAPAATPVAWRRARDRWIPRLATLDPRRELDVLDRLGGRVLLPEDDDWPAGLDDLGVRRPPCLWVRGGPLRPALDRSVAVVGSRASTAYGEHVAAEIGAGLADRSFAVLSGGAYGIDAAVHRGVLAGAGTTVAVMAGGVDRYYPAGNAALLATVQDAGAVVAEVPPGSAPMRSRFLRRNRLIAAMTGGTVVVEAARRSGALSTAGHAAALLRPVGAVPGPVTSMASEGCHRLLREGSAVCVTDAAEVVELVGDLGADLAPERTGAAFAATDVDEARRAHVRASRSPLDGLPPSEARVLDAVPARGAASAESIARTSGLGRQEVAVGLGYLELAGRVARAGGRWRRAGP